MAVVIVLAAVRPRLLTAPVAWLVRRLPRRRPQRPQPSGRPIELIARDVRRLTIAYRSRRPGLSWARSEGLRRAYDDVLAEACRALDHPHLLDVLPPGAERDAERIRVEALLGTYGLGLPDAA